MKHKIAIFDRKRGNPTTPTSPRIPWRTRKRQEPRQVSSSQSDLNSIRVNTADYRALDLLRQYDDERINISSDSQPTSERKQRHPTPSSNELQRCLSEGRSSRPQQKPRPRQGECLFLTSGYQINTRDSPTIKEILSSSKELNDEYNEGSFPFPELSRECLFLRGKGWLLILFIFLALTTIVGLSWYYSCPSSFSKTSAHAVVTGNPVARLLGLASKIDTTSDPRSIWINHVVKNDDDQILIAETFESRLNAEITPLLEKYVDKIWDDASSPPLTCHGEDRLMIAFSTIKSGSMPASITYETSCMSGSSSRTCVVKKQITDVRDLVVRLPSKSSRYMHAVRLEVDRSSKGDSSNSAGVQDIQDLGTCSGHIRVELSDASRLALQRYCGQDRKAYSEDLMVEPVSASNTRLINVYELKRLYGLLSSHTDASLSGSTAWDSDMLSTVVLDPLEHSRHFLAPIHVQQLLSDLRSVTNLHILSGNRKLRSPHIAVSSPREGDLSRHSTIPTPQVSEGKNDVAASHSRTTPQRELPLPPPSSSSSPVQLNTRQDVPSFNIQAPASHAPGTEEALSVARSPLASNGDSHGVQLRRTPGDTPSNLTDVQTARNAGNETVDHNATIDDEDKEVASDPASLDAQEDTTSDSTARESSVTGSDELEHTDNVTHSGVTRSKSQAATESSERLTASPVNNTTETSSSVRKERSKARRRTSRGPAHRRTRRGTAHRRKRRGSALRRTRRRSAAHLPDSQVSTKRVSSAPSPSQSSLSSPPSNPNAFAQGDSLTPSWNKPTMVPHSGVSAKSQETENGVTAMLSTGTQISTAEPAVAPGTTTQRNTSQGSTSPISAVKSLTQRSLSSPAEVPSHPIQRGLLPSQDASTPVTQARSPTRDNLSKAQELSSFVARRASSSLGALPSSQNKLSATYGVPLAHGSPSGTQRSWLPMPRRSLPVPRSSLPKPRSSLPVPRRSLPMPTSLTSTGTVLSSTTGGVLLRNGGSLTAQEHLISKQAIISPRGTLHPPLSHRVMDRSDRKTWSPRNFRETIPGARTLPISVLHGQGLRARYASSKSRVNPVLSSRNPTKKRPIAV